MKKITLIVFALFLPFSQAFALDDTAQELQQKFGSFSYLNADFHQIVTSEEGSVLQESWGKLYIQRPGKFRWEVTKPDEELIVANGQTMWLYSPFIDQVTIVNLNEAIEGTPFILLSGASDKQWEKYQVTKKDSVFTVSNKVDPKLNEVFSFTFDKNGKIVQFIVDEPEGQHSVFTLLHSPSQKALAKDVFSFDIPAGAEIDDQRTIIIEGGNQR